MNPRLHDVVRVPGRPWSVSCVCDEDGAGADLAFTVGLHALGLPELFLRARPTDGDDPGADWRLSHRDLADCLDDLAGLLVRGLLPPGTRVELDVDAGLAQVRLTARPETVGAALGVPGLAALGGDGLPDDRYVVPVGWALLRPPPRSGPPVLPDPARTLVDLGLLLEETDRLRAGVLARGGRPGRVPPRWRPPARPALTAGQRLGPLHALVVARGEQLLLADVSLLTQYVEAAFTAGADGPGEVLGPLPTVAAVCGRAGVPDHVEDAATDVVDLLTGPSGRPTARWRSAWRALRPRVCPVHAEMLEELARDALLVHVHGLLAVEAFADVLPAELVAAGRRSWAGAVRGTDT